MAKKVETKAKTAVAADEKINIQVLSTEYGVEAKDIRALLRANGFKAPEVAREPGTFGPKAKYEWDADSAELAKIRKLIDSTIENDPVAEPKAKPAAKAKKAAEVEVEEDIDEDEAEEPTPKKAKAKAKK